MILLRLPVPARYASRISQEFGENPEMYAVWGYPGHNGRDYAVPMYTPISAAHAGMLRHGALGGPYGCYVEVMQDTYYTLYAHLQARAMPGWVNAGDVIGYSGNTGNSTGPHMHLGLRIGKSGEYRGWVNPRSYMMKSKLSWHFQNVTPWASSVANQAGVRWVKQMYYSPDEADPFPNQWTVARCWCGGDHVEARYIEDGEEGGRRFFADMRSFYDGLRGKVWAIEGPNEPGVNSKDQRRNLAAFYRSWGYEMRQNGWRVVAGNFANGTPDVTNPQAIADLGPIWTCGYLALHEYGYPSMRQGWAGQVVDDPSWWTLRHRRLFGVLRELGYVVPRTFITECGIDGTGTPAGRVGWRRLTAGGWSDYLAQLRWWDGELQADGDVAAAFVFNSGALPGSDWESFEVSEPESRELAAVIAAGG